MPSFSHRDRESSFAAYRRARLIAFLLILACLPYLPAGAGTETELAPAINAVLSDPALRHGTNGVLVQSQRDGRTLFSLNADSVLMPASNMKIVTAALGMTRLGPDYRFRTSLATRGAVQRGKLKGDLILKGFGDPTLTTKTLQEFVQAVRDSGIRAINGSLLVDDSFFPGDRIGAGWSWDYLQDYYAMQVSALSLNENTVTLTVRPGGSAGQPALLWCTPATHYLELVNETVTGAVGTEETIRFSREPGANRIVVRGSIPADAKSPAAESLTVEDPALYCGTVLAQLLAEAGIPVSGGVHRIALPDSEVTILRQRQSAPLSEILPLFLKPSDNHIGEQIMRTVLAEDRARPRKEGEAPVATDSEAAAGALLQEIGGDPGSVRAADGSGLSRLNLVSPAALVQILRYVRRQPFAECYYQALPIAGVDGTLAHRMRGTRAAGNVHAKTGTINSVSCLSGYVTTAGGEPLFFSIMMNNFRGSASAARAAQDRICILLAELN